MVDDDRLVWIFVIDDLQTWCSDEARSPMTTGDAGDAGDAALNLCFISDLPVFSDRWFGRELVLS